MKKNTWAVVFSFCLIAFTVFIALDTFVLSSVYQADATQINTEMIIAAKENGESTQKESESPQTDDTDDSGKNGDGNPAGGGASQSDAGDSSIRQEPDQSSSPSQSDAGEETAKAERKREAGLEAAPGLPGTERNRAINRDMGIPQRQQKRSAVLTRRRLQSRLRR